ncbi:hypothetical protein BN8_02113 [Fibrisoma limi BUZ 3]|uniref:Uncharacterized protein n=1 Tax=Fibrisoma limi BUZ 3 TaxID=1185876 RepID=I2GGM5_9BACT|nr:hypothetical protein [Fibrisoma limi]CCH53050.1 hypothetical protein BN8_02113 [Fibrisoma limi BUZ 3]
MSQSVTWRAACGPHVHVAQALSLKVVDQRGPLVDELVTPVAQAMEVLRV